MAIDGLLEIATAIRNSSIPLNTSDIDTHYSRDDDIFYQSVTSTLVRSRFPDARRSLTDQLGFSIYIRRKRLLYQRRRKEKQSYPQEDISSRNDRLGIPPKSSPIHRDLGESNLPHARPLFPSTHLQQPPSTTHPSRMNKSLLNKRLKHGVTLSGRSSGSITRYDGQLEYPKHPQFDPNQKWCTCPYCFSPLLTTDVVTDAWKSVQCFVFNDQYGS